MLKINERVKTDLIFKGIINLLGDSKGKNSIY